MDLSLAVIIPTYNPIELKFLTTLNSVINQSYSQLKEIIVVDDGSDNDVESIIKKLKDKRIKFIKLPSNLGTGNARNVGINSSTSNFIIPFDDDDFMPKEFSKSLISKVTNENQIIASRANVKLNMEKSIGFFPEHLNSKFNEVLQNNIIPNSSLFSKKTWYELGGYSTFFKRVEDWDFWIRCYLKEKELIPTNISYDYNYQPEKYNTQTHIENISLIKKKYNIN